MSSVSPITVEEYQFSFNKYIENLETIIRNHLINDNDKKSLVVGLHAEWGSGKTHLLDTYCQDSSR